MKKEISKIVIDTIKDFNESLAEDDKISTNLEASLYGGESNLDSLGLVSLIVGLEQNIEDELEKTISLADEKSSPVTPKGFDTTRRKVLIIPKTITPVVILQGALNNMKRGEKSFSLRELNSFGLLDILNSL